MTREEILDAAALIISQKGFHGTSMQDIAEAVDLQKASLYHHIANKQEILVALLDQALDKLIVNMQDVLSLPLPTDEKLRQAVLVYLDTLMERREMAAVLLLEYRSLEPEFRARHMPRRDLFERLWRDLIQQGMDEGLFSCVDPDMAGRAFLGVLNWTVTWFRPEGKYSAKEIADQFAGIFLRGLLVRQN